MSSIMNNSIKEQLKLPEYGRLVLQMINHAKTINDKNERNEYAKLIIRIMSTIDATDDENAYSYRKYSADYHSKLWDHLAFLSNYELDIDYPVEITKVTPETYNAKSLDYPTHSIKYKHYGHILENMLTTLKNIEDQDIQKTLLIATANRMKRNLADWKGDGISNEKIADDIAEYSNGMLNPVFSNSDLINIDVNHKVKTPKLS